MDEPSGDVAVGEIDEGSWTETPIDIDLDGAADGSVIGSEEGIAVLVDTNDDSVIDTAVVDLNADAVPDVVMVEDPSGTTTIAVDDNGDGFIDRGAVDVDGDGAIDAAFTSEPGGGGLAEGESLVIPGADVEIEETGQSVPAPMTGTDPGMNPYGPMPAQSGSSPYTETGPGSRTQPQMSGDDALAQAMARSEAQQEAAFEQTKRNLAESFNQSTEWAAQQQSQRQAEFESAFSETPSGTAGVGSPPTSDAIGTDPELEATSERLRESAHQEQLEQIRRKGEDPSWGNPYISDDDDA
ncbi:MAG: hypothetical protein M3198_12520 [Actinomycetota bacterium]|nr:hypothetical protein [Actinomycetota bacterium]